MLEMRSCKNCQRQFEVSENDLAFLEKISPVFNNKKYTIPPPLTCPPCRQLRRLMPINQINLYKRKCDATGESIISSFHPASPYKVYNQPYWWGDSWDALHYEKDFDFNRPFFEQFHELSLTVPRPNLMTVYLRNENSDYTNYSASIKDCYLIFDSDYCRDTYYSYGVNHMTNCTDCYRSSKCELCYECVDSTKCYNCQYIEYSASCYDSAFLNDCESCKNCFMCCNLQHKEYYAYNKPVSKEEWQRLMAGLGEAITVKKYRQEFSEYKKPYPHKYMHGTHNENVTGDYLYFCKNVADSFDCNNCWDCRYAYQAFGSDVQDSMDFDQCGEFSQLLYESSNSGYNLNRVLFSMHIFEGSHDIFYSDQCHFSSNLFGCVGLKRKQYCILNKQYTKEEYEKLAVKIIEQMRADGTWGEFFPGWLSPFAYNETLAMEYSPLTKAEALKIGLSWLDDETKPQPATYTIPDSIKEVPPSIINEVLICETCSKNYKIITQEYEFYKKQGIALPRECFKCRHSRRRLARNPRYLWNRPCTSCAAPIQTTYSPQLPDRILCEGCYLKEVH